MIIKLTVFFEDWFEEPIEVPGFEWNDCLPRIGENLHPTVWIWDYDCADFENTHSLSRMATEAINRDKTYPAFSYQDWLYDICIECDTITSISYRRDKNKRIYASILLGVDKINGTRNERT